MDREALDMALKGSDRSLAANAEGDLAHTCLTLTCVFTTQILARQLCNLTGEFEGKVRIGASRGRRGEASIGERDKVGGGEE